MHKNEPGRCPSCETVGEVGEPCRHRVCRKRGFHHVPESFAYVDERDLASRYLGRRVDEYLVVARLGEGGFGEVYLVLQLPILLRAAFKISVLDEAPKQLRTVLLKQFELEARALSQVAHPNVVKLLKYGALDGFPYMVMELVDNATDLSAEIERREVSHEGFSAEEIKQIVKQLLNGLQAAHEAHIVHRDIKPDNIMLQKAPGHPILVRIVDFGLAKNVSESRTTLHTMGTPAYVSPEQLLGKNIGPWSDLYAVGVITFELLTGRHPFQLDTVQAVVKRKLDPDYDPISRLDGLNVNSVALSFFRKSLAQNPDERYRDSRQLKAAFLDVLEALKKDPIRKVEAEPGVSRSDITQQSSGASSVERDTPGTGSQDAFANWMDAEKRRLDAQRRTLQAQKVRPPRAVASLPGTGDANNADLHRAKTESLSSPSPVGPDEDNKKKAR